MGTIKNLAIGLAMLGGVSAAEGKTPEDPSKPVDDPRAKATEVARDTEASPEITEVESKTGRNALRVTDEADGQQPASAEGGADGNPPDIEGLLSPDELKDVLNEAKKVAAEISKEDLDFAFSEAQKEGLIPLEFNPGDMAEAIKSHPEKVFQMSVLGDNIDAGLGAIGAIGKVILFLLNHIYLTLGIVGYIAIFGREGFKSHMKSLFGLAKKTAGRTGPETVENWSEVKEVSPGENEMTAARYIGKIETEEQERSHFNESNLSQEATLRLETFRREFTRFYNEAVNAFKEQTFSKGKAWSALNVWARYNYFTLKARAYEGIANMENIFDRNEEEDANVEEGITRLTRRGDLRVVIVPGTTPTYFDRQNNPIEYARVLEIVEGEERDRRESRNTNLENEFNRKSDYLREEATNAARGLHRILPALETFKGVRGGIEGYVTGYLSNYRGDLTAQSTHIENGLRNVLERLEANGDLKTPEKQRDYYRVVVEGQEAFPNPHSEALSASNMKCESEIRRLDQQISATGALRDNLGRSTGKAKLLALILALSAVSGGVYELTKGHSHPDPEPPPLQDPVKDSGEVTPETVKARSADRIRESLSEDSDGANSNLSGEEADNSRENSARTAIFARLKTILKLPAESTDDQVKQAWDKLDAETQTRHKGKLKKVVRSRVSAFNEKQVSDIINETLGR